MKNRVFVVLNLLGLTIGLGTSLILIQYAVYEFSYDKFHENSDRIYRIRYDNFRNGIAEFESAAAVPAVGAAMKRKFPEVLECAWACPVRNGYFKTAGKSIHEEKFQIVTPGFLKMFSWEFIQGDTSALSQPRSMVITESCAINCFGHTDVLGNIIEYEDGTRYRVRGIIRDVPGNSHIKFSILVSPDVMYEELETSYNDMWNRYDFNTYILLKEDTDPSQIEDKFNHWLSGELSYFWEKDNRRQHFSLQPIQKIHLYSNLSQESEPDESGNGGLVIILSIVAISILMIAWINYINLSSSMAWKRAKEVALRKTAGAGKRHILSLFVGEALILHILAAGLSLVFIELALPGFSKLIGRELSLSLLKDPAFWIILVILLSAGSLISGIYPAMSMSFHRPIDALYGKPAGFRSGLNLRKPLVILQLIVSIGFISSAFIALSQFNFIRNIPSGIDTDQTMVIWGPGIEYDSSYSKQEQNFKNQITNLEEVRSLTSSSNVPGIEIQQSEILKQPDEQTGMIYHTLIIDEEYIPSYGLELLAGRNFIPPRDSHQTPVNSDENSVILNACASEQMGFSSPDEAIGKKIISRGNELSIIGVIKDYYQMSTKQKPHPLVHLYNGTVGTYLSVKLASADSTETISKIENVWNESFPGVPFGFFILKDICEKQYRMDKQINKALGLFAILSVFIAVLGLYGLSVHSIQHRSKEIGIRKVTGASVQSILGMLYREYLELILIAFLIATPVSWLAMHKWLMTYPEHIGIQPHNFLLAVLIVMIVSLLFVSFQTIRAASMNPVRSISTE